MKNINSKVINPKPGEYITLTFDYKKVPTNVLYDYTMAVRDKFPDNELIVLPNFLKIDIMTIDDLNILLEDIDSLKNRLKTELLLRKMEEGLDNGKKNI